MELRADVAALGALTGLTYGLLAVGLVIAFRSSRVLNLAHGQVGAFAAVLLVIGVSVWEIPYWVALPAVVVAGAGVAALVELTVVRRLRAVPPLMTLLATLGAGQVLFFLGAALAPRGATGELFPQPPGLPDWQVGALRVSPAATAILLVGPATVALLWWLLSRTAFGLTLRASAANPDVARTLGIRAGRHATAAWALAGGLSAITAVLVLPSATAGSPESLGPSLLLRALAPAVLAGMMHLPLAMGLGVALGIAEGLLLWNVEDAALADAVIAIVLAGAVALRPVPALRRTDARAWTPYEQWPALPAAAQRVRTVAALRPAVAGLALAAALSAPLLLDAGQEVRLATVACMGLVGLSVWVLTGLWGELSLGQVAIAGVGATAALAAGRMLGEPLLGLAAAAGAGAAAAMALGAASARAGGLGLPVVTLAFAVSAQSWLLGQSWALGEGAQLPALVVGPLDSSDPAHAYLAAVAALAVALAALLRVGHGRLGRRLRALRDNEAQARAMGVPVWPARLQALALAGTLAGLGGALLAHAIFQVSAGSFAAAASVDVVAAAVLGGLALASGAVVGALYVFALPAFVDLSSAALAATAAGWLVLLLYLPGGFAALLLRLRRPLVSTLLRLGCAEAQLADPQPAHAAVAPPTDPVSVGAAVPEPAAGVVVELDRVTKRFGDVVAVQDVSMRLHAREVVGLIGPNGAGKTTLLDVVSGLERADAGRILLEGRDLSGLSCEHRARRGLARTFQDSPLFPTMTVRDFVRVAVERPGRPGGAGAEELVSLLGLARFGDHPLRALSTGTRRVAELAGLLAFAPRVVLLDEPSAGLAQPEVEALAALLLRVRDELGAALLVVEHDLALLRAISDRVVVMSLGSVVAEGPAADLLAPRGPEPVEAA